MMEYRLKKAIEVKTALINMGINDETCYDLKLFSKILSNWVKDGKYITGEIELVELDRKLVYQLVSPNNTVVKLSKFRI